MLKKSMLVMFLGTSLVSCSSTKETNQVPNDFDKNIKNNSNLSKMMKFPEKMATVNFGFDSANLKRSEISEIEGVVREIKAAPMWTKIVIKGHTDQIGSKDYNKVLGLKRAKMVKKLLVDYGMSPDRLIVKSLGETMPKVLADTWDERSLNRRATIELISDKSRLGNVSMAQ